MDGNSPLVSIIVRTKDRPKLLKRALESIAAQTYRPIEVVLVNDGGCHVDIEELKGGVGDVSVNYIRLEKNTGRAHAGNVGIENAKGEYVGFLDDDDEFYPEHVDTLVSELSKGNYYKVAYADSYLAFHEIQAAPDEYVLKKKERLYSEDFDRERLLFENYIPFMCLMFEKNVLTKWRFEEDLHTHEDWRLLTLISRNHEFLHLKKVTCQYNIYAASIENYLESRYDIQKFASIVFERNKEYVSWSSWMHFKGRMDNILRERDTRHQAVHIKHLEALREQDVYMRELETYTKNLRDVIKGKDQYIANLAYHIDQRDQRIIKIESLARDKDFLLQSIYGSRGWKALLLYYRIRDKLLPVNSIRRHFVKRVYDLIVFIPENLIKKKRHSLRRS